MKKDDVLVSAELAKEKLARIPEMWVHSKTCDPTGAPCTHQIMGAEVAQLIRNTDLTDCQQPDLVETVCKIVVEWWKGDGCEFDLKAFVQSRLGVIAPAPDQGSVRNATDEQDAKRYRWMRQNWAYADGTIFFDGFNLGPMATLDEAIDAIRDQKDD